jgi:hypothetical protein
MYVVMSLCKYNIDILAIQLLPAVCCQHNRRIGRPVTIVGYTYVWYAWLSTKSVHNARHYHCTVDSNVYSCNALNKCVSNCLDNLYSRYNMLAEFYSNYCSII